ncbi:hypothetical protein, partial [Thiolapillus sp.]|uniref:hypothetical protein n=1 Tax=Thiolapillus sp. TaxID=2017437 RepID=UPI003AF95BEF
KLGQNRFQALAMPVYIANDVITHISLSRISKIRLSVLKVFQRMMFLPSCSFQAAHESQS